MIVSLVATCGKHSCMHKLVTGACARGVQDNANMQVHHKHCHIPALLDNALRAVLRPGIQLSYFDSSSANIAQRVLSASGQGRD